MSEIIPIRPDQLKYTDSDQKNHTTRASFTVVELESVDDVLKDINSKLFYCKDPNKGVEFKLKIIYSALIVSDYKFNQDLRKEMLLKLIIKELNDSGWVKRNLTRREDVGSWAVCYKDIKYIKIVKNPFYSIWKLKRKLLYLFCK